MKILVVDDDREVRLLVRLAIDNHGGTHTVDEARDGAQAVEEARRLQPDVVIMDVKMPVMNGVEATRQIKEAVPHADVIAFTSLEDPKVDEAMKQAGASSRFGRDELDQLLTHIGIAS